MDNRQFGIVLAAIFAGSFFGGVALHVVLCSECKRELVARKSVKQVAEASAEMNGQVPSPQVAP